MGRWRARARRARDEIVDAGAWLRPAFVGVVVGGAIAAFQVTQISPTIGGGAATLAMRFVDYVRYRSARDRAIGTVGLAAVHALDTPIHFRNQGVLILPNGTEATLRDLAEYGRGGRLAEIVSPHTAMNMGQGLSARIGTFKEEAALGLAELAQLRARANDMIANLDEAIRISNCVAFALKALWPAPTVFDGSSAEAYRDRLAAPLDAAARAAARLELRWDPEAAATRALERSARVTRIREDRRCAHRAIFWAAIRGREEIDGELRSGEQDWIAREQRLIWARERVTGVANIETSYADPPTVELARTVVVRMSEAVGAAGVGAAAQRALSEGTPEQVADARQHLGERLTEATGRLTAARDALSADVTALEAMGFG